MNLFRTGKNGCNLTKYYESLRLKPYFCSSNIPTIGWGSTYYPSGRRVKITDRAITVDEADIYFNHSLIRIERLLFLKVKSKLNQNEFDALVSFIYNVGAGNFCKSTLLMKLNRGDHAGASNEFWKWRRSNGKILKGLVRRRKSEYNLFISE